MGIEFNDGPFSMKCDYSLFLCFFSEKYAARHLNDLVGISICKHCVTKRRSYQTQGHFEASEHPKLTEFVVELYAALEERVCKHINLNMKDFKQTKIILNNLNFLIFI